MKKLFILIASLFFMANCTKSEDVNLGEHSVITLSASLVSMMESKAISLKDEWVDGDQIAVFVKGKDGSFSQPYCYDVAGDGCMTPSNGGDPLSLLNTELQRSTFYAFSPYNESFTTVEEYQSVEPNDTVDYMSSVAAGNTSIDFSFSHDMAAIFVEFITSDHDLTFTVRVKGKEYKSSVELDGYYGVLSLFVAPESDIEEASLLITTANISKLYELSDESISEWKAGHFYTYTDVFLDLDNGDGTLESPYLICTADDLCNVGSGEDGRDMDSHYMLACDIDLSDVDFKSIGREFSPFTGSINGMCFEVSNLTGTLFNATNGATIVNLGVVGSGANFVNSTTSSNIVSCYATDIDSNETTYYVSHFSNSRPVESGDLTGDSERVFNNSAYIYNFTNPIISANAWEFEDGTPKLLASTPKGGLLGDGSELDPYLISSAMDLRVLSADYYSGLSYDNTSHYKMTQDINLCGVNSQGDGIPEYRFTSIGTSKNVFKGTFDGNNYEITGLYIHDITVDEDGNCNPQALFGSVSDFNIKNLGVSGYVTGVAYVGGIVGFINADSNSGGIYNNSSITSCFSNVVVIGYEFVGGILGGGASGINMKYCYNTGSVTGNNVGGLFGINFGGNNNNYCISNYNIGTVHYGSSSVFYGALIGCFSSIQPINRCYYLDSACSNAIGNHSDVAGEYEGKTEEYMKSSDFISDLNGADTECYWQADDMSAPINSGYPILKWQNLK